MNTTRESRWRTALRWLVGLLLVWAALSKLANLHEFHASVLAYQLPLPDFALVFAVITLPWLELLCGLMLMGRVRIEAALLWAIILFAFFAVATGQAWARGLEISCGCFDLRVLGIDPDADSRIIRFIESAAFACVRAVLLLATAFVLFQSWGRGERAVHPA